MACNSVRDLLTRGEAFAQEGDVLVVPGVAVRNRRPIADAINLVAIIPPGHHPRVLWRIVAQPPIRLAEVVYNHALLLTAAFRRLGRLAAEHNLRLRQMLGEAPAMRQEAQ